MRILDRFRRKDQGVVALADDEKGFRYEQDPTREPKERPAARKEVTNSRRRYIGNWAPHPGLIRGLRFVLCVEPFLERSPTGSVLPPAVLTFSDAPSTTASS